MLAQLTIDNFAIVDHLELEFSTGMTAITGETGAGKSILLDALSLCLGARADANSVRQGAERAELTAHFDLAGLPEARAWLTARELSSEECVLRRVISAQGRTRAWINGTPCAISELKGLGALLIDIHAQHAHQSLMHAAHHMQLLDEFAGTREQLDQVRGLFREWQQLRKRLSQRQEDGDALQARRQLLRYQVEELDMLALNEGELSELEAEQSRLAHAEQTLILLEAATQYCAHDDGGALIQLHHALAQLAELPDHESAALANTLTMLEEARIQIEEAHSELDRHASTVELDPARLQAVDARLSDVYRIARKHHIMPDEVVELHQRLSRELAGLDNGDEDLEQLTHRTQTLHDQWRQQARNLSHLRQRHAPGFAKEVLNQLAYLGMEKASFEVAITPLDTPQADGMDHVQFLISANPGQPPRPLARVASGGELSRISLAIQVVAARHSTMPTLVFDEVDVGISGATAEIVGQLLRQLSTSGQIFCVTHLPQVAAQAHQHLHIEKRSDDTTTHTQMARLNESGRIRELARMLGGVHLSEHTLAHAREMLDSGQRSIRH